MRHLLRYSSLAIGLFLLSVSSASAQTGLYVDSAGNVGVGTDTPSDPLEVHGETSIVTGTTTTNFRQQVVEFFGTADQIIAKSGGSTADLSIKTGSPLVTRARLRGDGNIEIIADNLDIDASTITVSTPPTGSGTPLCFDTSAQQIVLCE